MDDPIDQQLAAIPIETRRTMFHESLLTAWSFNTPYRAQGLSFVNIVPEDDTWIANALGLDPARQAALDATSHADSVLTRLVGRSRLPRVENPDVATAPAARRDRVRARLKERVLR